MFSLILKTLTKNKKVQIHELYNEKHFCVKAVFRRHIIPMNTSLKIF